MVKKPVGSGVGVGVGEGVEVGEIVGAGVGTGVGAGVGTAVGAGVGDGSVRVIVNVKFSGAETIAPVLLITLTFQKYVALESKTYERVFAVLFAIAV